MPAFEKSQGTQETSFKIGVVSATPTTLSSSATGLDIDRNVTVDGFGGLLRRSAIDATFGNERVLVMNSAAAPRTASLPSIAAGFVREAIIFRTGGNNVTIGAFAGETVDGGATLVLASNGDSVLLVPELATLNWIIAAQAVAGGAGGENLTQTLGFGNTTGADEFTAGFDIVLSIGDAFRGGDAQAASNDAGGPVLLQPGAGDGTGVSGALIFDDPNSAFPGDPRGAFAVDLQAVRVIGSAHVAAGTRSVLLGGYDNQTQVSDSLVAGVFNHVYFTGAVTDSQNAGPTVFGEYHDIQLDDGFEWEAFLVAGESNNLHVSAPGFLAFGSFWLCNESTLDDPLEHSSTLVSGLGHTFGSGYVLSSAIVGEQHWMQDDSDVEYTFVCGIGTTVEDTAVLANSLAMGEGHVVPAGTSANSCAYLGYNGYLDGNYLTHLGSGGAATVQGAAVQASMSGTSAIGMYQAQRLVVQGETNGTAAGVITLRAGLPPGIVQSAPKIFLDHAWKFQVDIVAYQVSGSAGAAGDAAGWATFQGVLKNVGGTVSLVGTPTPAASSVPAWADASLAAWVATLAADNVNDALSITLPNLLNQVIRVTATITFPEAGEDVA